MLKTRQSTRFILDESRFDFYGLERSCPNLKGATIRSKRTSLFLFGRNGNPTDWAIVEDSSRRTHISCTSPGLSEGDSSVHVLPSIENNLR